MVLEANRGCFIRHVRVSATTPFLPATDQHSQSYGTVRLAHFVDIDMAGGIGGVVAEQHRLAGVVIGDR